MNIRGSQVCLFSRTLHTIGELTNPDCKRNTNFPYYETNIFSAKISKNRCWILLFYSCSDFFSNVKSWDKIWTGKSCNRKWNYFLKSVLTTMFTKMTWNNVKMSLRSVGLCQLNPQTLSSRFLLKYILRKGVNYASMFNGQQAVELFLFLFIFCRTALSIL